jgi:hypothetical protein
MFSGLTGALQYTVSDVMRLAPLFALAVTIWLYRGRLPRLARGMLES